MLRALATRNPDIESRDVMDGKGAKKRSVLALDDLEEAFAEYGVSDSTHPGLLKRFWSTLCNAAGGRTELDVRFVTEEVCAFRVCERV
jgi:hypothetical protein